MTLAAWFGWLARPIDMEHPPLLEAWTEMGRWLMVHPMFAFGRNMTGFTMLYDETVIDTEPCKFGDPDDAARAINTLLERRRRI